MGFTSYTKVEDVVDGKSFARYCQQRMGIPYPTGKQIAILNRSLKAFFKEYPHCDYRTLVRVADWCHARKKRYATPEGVVSSYRYAWAAGAIPELTGALEPIDEALEASIVKALEVESDPAWRERLIGSTGSGRKLVYEAWSKTQGVAA